MMLLRPFLVALLMAVTSCATPLLSGPPPTPDLSAVPPYEIGIDDVLNVHVWRDEEISTQAPVRQDGMITLPLIGDVRAAGQTPEALAEAVQAKLVGYLKEPRVTVSVTEMRSNAYLSRIRVTGAVSQPISIQFRRGMTVLDAILEAGGPQEFAAVNRARLVRVIDGQAQQFRLELDGILNRGVLETNYALFPGDVIAVPERVL